MKHLVLKVRYSLASAFLIKDAKKSQKIVFIPRDKINLPFTLYIL